MKSSKVKLVLSALVIVCLWGRTTAAQGREVGLLEQLKRADAQVRRNAARQIEEDRSFSVRAHGVELFSALSDSDDEVRAWIASALMERLVADPSLSAVMLQNSAALLKALSDPNDAVRELAVKIVYFIKPNPPSDFAGPLIQLLSDGKNSIRRSALAAMAEIRPVDPKVRMAILSLMSAEGELKGLAVRVLGEMRDADPQTVTALTIALKDKNQFVQSEAIKALARIGHPAASAQSALEILLRDTAVDEHVKKLAEQAIKAIQ